MLRASLSFVSKFLRNISNLNETVINAKSIQKYCTVNTKTYYSILGLKPDAKEEEIKNAYYALSKKYHPDLNIGNKFAESKILEINEAFEVLGNKIEKEKYDSKVFPKIWEKNSFIYDLEEDDENSTVPSFTYRRMFRNIPHSAVQYYKHLSGIKKRKQRHRKQKEIFNKSQASQRCSHINNKFK